MARHYTYALTNTFDLIEIPAPAIDMTTGQQRFGASGSYVSGGGYVRRSQFGGQVLNASWNNLSIKDMNRLHTLNEGGIFYWDNPMARSNPIPPWLARHGNLDALFPGASGYSTSTYLLDRFPGITIETWATTLNHYRTYPRPISMPKYTFNNVTASNAILTSFIVPEGFEAHVWAVGESTGTARLRVGNFSQAVIPLNTVNSAGAELPTEYWSGSPSAVLPAERFTIVAEGTGTLSLANIQVRVQPVGTPVDTSYSPGLGNTGLEFTEEGLQLVQHSAALDMQSATATWMETGWWK